MPQALFIERSGPNPPVRLRELDPDVLPDGDLDVDVYWSGLNYKDALAVTGRSPIVRSPFPFVPGIDLAGVALNPVSGIEPGDAVLQTGWGLGENRFGGFSQRARLNAGHVVRIPEGLSPRDAMVVGTAGFTAMLACMALERHGLGSGPVGVTGASGGVGSFAVAFLSRMGHPVAAVTGSDSGSYLGDLGADEVLHRSELDAGARKPLDSARWGGAVDSVGGRTLEAILSQMQTRCAVSACGLAGGSGLETTVFPFILRGVALLGIDSNTCPQPLRNSAWSRIADLVDPPLVALVGAEIGLEEVPVAAAALLEGGHRGRTAVRCQP